MEGGAWLKSLGPMYPALASFCYFSALCPVHDGVSIFALLFLPQHSETVSQNNLPP